MNDAKGNENMDERDYPALAQEFRRLVSGGASFATTCRRRGISRIHADFVAFAKQNGLAFEGQMKLWQAIQGGHGIE